jgi:FkbH-like protein
MAGDRGAAGAGLVAFGPAATVPSASGDLAEIAERMIELAPALVRQRAFLPAANWRLFSPDQVMRLQLRLAGAGMKLPRWLLQDLLVAGHSLPVEPQDGSDGGLWLLSQLNALAPGSEVSSAARNVVLDLANGAPVDPDVATAITQRLLAHGYPSLACKLALGQWPNAPAALRLLRRDLPLELDRLPPVRVRLAGFSTTDLFAEALMPAFASVGCRVEVASAEFGSVLAALLEPDDSSDGLHILLDQNGFLTADWRQAMHQGADLVDRKIDMFADAIASYARQSGRSLFINTLPANAVPQIGHVDIFHKAGAASVAAAVNARLARLANDHASIHLVDADIALADIAPTRRTEAKHWYYGRVAYSEAASRALAKAFALAWQARQRGPVKVVAVDFDNTLWGGVFGDDGIGKLQCGDDFPGNAFKAFQEECLRLKSQGMLLVALSKNNPDALGVFAAHPGMSLRAEDFAATAVDWGPKPENIRRLAAELNLGIDSFLFLDDSPHEREAMRRMCPEVVVPEMPADPALRPHWLRTLSCTWPVRLTAEDAQRSELYAAERKAKQLRESALSYDDYLRDLDQHLLVEPLAPDNLARAAQLHQRTNQFNLTTQRFSEAELAAFMSSRTALAMVGTVTDRFASHGIVIAGIATMDGRAARIESLVMSCRVIARQVETAFLGAMIEKLCDSGIETIEGFFYPTAKNALVRDFFSTHGFSPQSFDGAGTAWVWEKSKCDLPGSPHIKIKWRQS